MSLVADYGDSSLSETENSNESNNEASENEDNRTTESEFVEKLPTPDFNEASSSSTSKNSVFSNPFKEAENAKQAILEKHVKMVSTPDNVRIINGKKICWNYRKGRCRFGHNCIYAHDSDLQKSKKELEEQKQIQQTVLCTSDSSSGVSLQSSNEKQITGKKRPGLTQGLVPGKKVMKAYHKQNNKTVTLKQK